MVVEVSKPILFSIINGLHSEIMLTQIILVVTMLKIVGKLQITKVMTDFEHKYEVELESAILDRLDAKFAKTIMISIEKNLAANKSITSKVFLH